MTQEDKYDKVLEKATRIYNGANDYVKDIISDIFPIEDLLDKIK